MSAPVLLVCYLIFCKMFVSNHRTGNSLAKGRFQLTGKLPFIEAAGQQRIQTVAIDHLLLLIGDDHLLWQEGRVGNQFFNAVNNRGMNFSGIGAAQVGWSDSCRFLHHATMAQIISLFSKNHVIYY